MRTLVIAEHNGKEISAATLSVVAAAKELGAPIDMLVASNGAGDVVNHAKSVDAVERFYILAIRPLKMSWLKT